VKGIRKKYQTKMSKLQIFSLIGLGFLLFSFGFFQISDFGF